LAKVLVINSGSSSIKFKLFDMPKEVVLLSGLIEEIGKNSQSKTIIKRDKVYSFKKSLKDHKEAFSFLESLLFNLKVLNSFSELTAVGHRVVHGGDEFFDSVVIDNSVIQKIKALSPLAPLHNLANLAGIEAIKKLAPNLKQVAVFDTSFHQSMPEVAYTYALPKSWRDDYKIRKYGFHGTSYRYILKASSKILKKSQKKLNLISLHLGNGASICAIKEGESIDTSMGFTPLEGLVMGTRSGDIDPSIIFYLQREKSLSSKEIEETLNRKSGLLGLGGSSNMRDILSQKERNKDAKLAYEKFIYRIIKYIGSYAMILGEIDAVTFSGGIGENSPEVRADIIKGLKLLDITLNESKNLKNTTFISSRESKIATLVIKTDEEIVIAKEAMRVK